jgi:membrane protease YdiL (CAAX protease family)
VSVNIRNPHTRDALVALLVAAIATALVTAASTLLPDKYVATAVGFVFLGATWLFVWRRDDPRVEASGLALGGLVLPGKVDLGRLLGSAGRAIGWAAVLSAITFVPFFFGWRWFWHPRAAFALHVVPFELVNDIFGQLIIIALPEEAFYRGFLQSRLDEAFPAFGARRFRIFGAEVGPAILITSTVFALGHFATIRDPARLAVFFPSLLFGWIRQRTGGIGAGLTYHASCNVFSGLLGKGFHVY